MLNTVEIMLFMVVTSTALGIACKQKNRGQQLAENHCQSCHSLPEPNLLDKKTWKKFVLPEMSRRLGMNYNEERASYDPVYKSTYPSMPVLSATEWKLIEDYYIENAPEKIPAFNPTLPIAVDLPSFRVKTVQGPPAVITLVKIDSAESSIYVGEAKTNSLSRLNNLSDKSNTLYLNSPPSSLIIKKDGLLVISMGSLNPSDIQEGEVVFLEDKTITDTSQYKVIMNKLPRPVHASLTDFNSDGEEDLIVSGFGNLNGELSLYLNFSHGVFKHTLIDLPGAIKTVVYDFNGDQRMDIMALVAQATESFFIYYNEGNGKFQREKILTFPPSFGFNSFELADFNKDGFQDIISTNGDNGDYEPLLKNYHGVRIFLNDQRNKFKQSLFIPVHGATKAIPRDFDQDGNLDIVAISFFPDYKNSPHESFLYFKSRGYPKYSACSFKESYWGRWNTMDVGDWDKDGDEDIVLGSFARTDRSVPPSVSHLWKEKKIQLLILENKLLTR